MLYKFISFYGNSIMSKNFSLGIRKQGQPPPDMYPARIRTGGTN